MLDYPTILKKGVGSLWVIFVAVSTPEVNNVEMYFYRDVKGEESTKMCSCDVDDLYSIFPELI